MSKLSIRTLPEETRMCQGLGATQTWKLNLRIKYLKIENELQKKIISQLKTLHDSVKNVKLSRCGHFNCKIDHMKYNFISIVHSAKPNLPRETATQKSGHTNDAFIMKCKRAVNKC